MPRFDAKHSTSILALIAALAIGLLAPASSAFAYEFTHGEANVKLDVPASWNVNVRQGHVIQFMEASGLSVILEVATSREEMQALTRRSDQSLERVFQNIQMSDNRPFTQRGLQGSLRGGRATLRSNNAPVDLLVVVIPRDGAVVLAIAFAPRGSMPRVTQVLDTLRPAR